MIVFYDIDSKLPGKIWSPNTLKTRMSLTYKRLPFRTEWIEYPDIEPLCKSIGAPPTGQKDDGSDLYTAPFIFDEDAGKAVSESAVIAKYLDDAYPRTAPLFPKAALGSATIRTDGAIAIFESLFMNHVFQASIPFMIANNTKVLNARSEVFYRKAREATFKSVLEDLSPAGSLKRAEDWENVRQGLNRMSDILDMNNEDEEQDHKPNYFLGEVFSYADIVVASALLWIKIEVEDYEWDMVASWNDNRWAKLLEETKQYYAVEW